MGDVTPVMRHEDYYDEDGVFVPSRALAEIERLREALVELDEMHDDCTCRAGKKIIREALDG